MKTQDCFVVISGVSGRFPQCDDVDELCEKLFSGVDLVTENDDRWPKGVFGLPLRNGVLKDISQFDGDFFGIKGAEANFIEPMIRILLEVTHEALCDAGINYKTWNGKRVAHYCAYKWPDARRIIKVDDEVAVNHMNFYERHLNFFFNISGGCFSFDTACSSFMTAFNQAVLDLGKGTYDIAVLTTGAINVAPSLTIQFKNLGMVSMDGMCRFLDQNASGYVPSECIGSMILQRKSDAKRIHATVLASDINADGYKDEGPTYPKSQAQSKLLRSCIKMAGLRPDDIDFIECHGTGTQAGDKVEVRGIVDAVDPDRNRNRAIYLGSVKSNMGHSEMASGFNSIVKAILVFKEGFIPANLHCDQPSPTIPELMDGRVLPVMEKMPFKGRAIPIGNYGFGGANSYLVLGKHEAENPKMGEGSEFESNKGFLLFLCSGRTTSSVNHMIEKLGHYQRIGRLSPYLMKLVNKMSTEFDSTAMNYRGFCIASKTSLNPSPITQRKPSKPALYLVFSGFGSQRPGMAAPLMSVDCFAKSLKECTDFIDPNGDLNMYEYLTNYDCRLDIGSYFCLGLAIFSAAFIDLLRELNIEPDGYFGHSFGHLSAAYYDGFIKTKQEFMTIARILSESIMEEKSPKQTMISVGKSWRDLQGQVPDGIYPACFNSLTNTTLGGYSEIIQTFLNHLKSNNIFVRELDTSSKAFHTPLFTTQILRDKLRTLNLGLRKQSKKLLPTFSYSGQVEHGAPENLEKYVISLIENPVQLVDTCKKIPENALFFEVSAKRFMAPLLMTNCPSSQVVIPLSEKAEKPFEYFLAQLGELFSQNINFSTDALYSEVEGPAPMSTPFISSLIKFDHSHQHFVRKFPQYFSYSGQTTLNSPSQGKDNSTTYLRIGDLTIAPIGMLIAKVVGNFKSDYISSESFDEIVLILKNVEYTRPMVLKNDSVKLSFEFLPISDCLYRFNLSDDKSLILTGLITVTQGEEEMFQELDYFDGYEECLLVKDDFYKKSSELGYEWSEEFKLINQMNSGNGLIVCDLEDETEDVFKILEAAIQMSLVKSQVDRQYFCKADSIKVSCNNNNYIASFVHDEYMGTFKADGIEIKNISFQAIHCDEIQKLSMNGNEKLDLNLECFAALKTAFLPQEVSFFNNLSSKQMRNFSTSTCISQDDAVAAFTGKNQKGLFFVGFGTIKHKEFSILRPKQKVSGENPNFIWPLPDTWTAKYSSHLLLNLTLACYCLFLKANLLPGQTCLVISKYNFFVKTLLDICDRKKCQVYLASNNLNMQSSTSKLPESCTIVKLPDQDTERYLKGINQEGVDLVLFLDDLIDIYSAVQCVRENGKFIQLLPNSLNNHDLGMGVFLKGISVIGVNHRNFLIHESKENLFRVHALVSECLTMSGSTLTDFPAELQEIETLVHTIQVDQ